MLFNIKQKQQKESPFMITVTSLDHLVLTVRSIAETTAFYEMLGMTAITFGEGRTALTFGQQKINLHEYQNEFEPKAANPTPGSEDLCFLVAQPVSDIKKMLEKKNIKVIEGPVERTGAQSAIESIYLRDPDNNLIELSNMKS